MKRLLILIPLAFLCCLGCQQGEEVVEQPSADIGMDAQTIQDRVEELESATSSAYPIIGS